MRSCVSGLLALIVAVAPAVWAQPADQTALFKEATAREATLRHELTASRAGSAAPTLRRVRTLVGAFEDLARLFPASGLADKALWQGASLSADAFWQLGEEVDRGAALRLLAALSAGFPTSLYGRQAAPLQKRLTAAPAGTATPSAEPTARPAVMARAVDRPAPAAADATTLAPPAAARVRAEPATTRVRADSPSAAAALVSLTAVRREQLADAARITLELDREVPYQTERIVGPDRVFIDLPQTRAAAPLTGATLPFSDDVVRRIRIGVQPGHVTRVVLDLEGGGRHSIYTLYNPYRIVVDVERLHAESAARPAPAPAPSAPRAATLHLAAAAARTTARANNPVGHDLEQSLEAVPAPSVAPIVTAPVVSSVAPTPARISSDYVSAAVVEITTAPSATPPAALPATLPGTRPTAEALPPTAPAINARGRFSLSRQLGLGIARIVIDAGHGGRDSGARVKGLSEADLTLDVALRLETLLQKQAGVEVIQTRRNNSYVSLEERTEIANRSEADLFVSIHVNASADQRARGVETYFLNFAPNAEAEAIAARENAGANRQMRQLPDLVKAIAMNNKIDESRDLASMVQQSLFSQVRKSDRRARNLGVKQAPFMVLVGASMPSILTEISFVTNQQDAGLLATEKYRQQIAEALLAGITRYQQALKKATAVAAQ